MNCVVEAVGCASSIRLFGDALKLGWRLVRSSSDSEEKG
jgi:hypothetical protein